LRLGNLRPPAGSVKKSIRRGRGEASGKGKTSGKGHKGQLARSGARRVTTFEGGQMPLWRRLPKKGFKNFNRVEYAVVNVADLNRFEDGIEVTQTLLYNNGMVKKGMPVKLLGNGELRVKINVKLDGISKTAKEKVEQAGGKVEEVS